MHNFMIKLMELRTASNVVAMFLPIGFSTPLHISVG